jgi:hypothetical protein
MDTQPIEAPDRSAQTTQRAYARLAGLMFLVVLGFDIAGLAIASAIQGSGSFLDMSRNIAASEPLYRIGLLLGLAGSLATIPLAIGLYVTLKRIDPNLALTALLFRVVEAAGIGNAGFATLQIYLAANHDNAFSTRQLGALAGFGSGPEGSYVSAIFFCVGSTIFFYLFLKSAYIPKVMAAWGLLASLVYMLAFIGSLVAPQHSGMFLLAGSIPIAIAEVSTGLWLLIKGISISAVSTRSALEAGRT